MESKKEDLRVKITKQLLYDSLITLIQNKRFEDIKVTDICELAEVHRTTFYKHFNNKSELLVYVINKLSENFMAQVDEHKYDSLENFYKVIIGAYLQHVFTNKDLFVKILKYNEHGIAMETWYDITVNRFAKRLKENETNMDLYDIPVEIIAAFYVSATFRTIKFWLLNQDICNEEELTTYLNRLNSLLL